MSEVCETAGHDYIEIEKTTYKLIERSSEPDIPAMLSLFSFIGLIVGTVVSASTANMLPFVGALIGFIVSMFVFTQARFFTETTALICKRCGTKINP